MKKLIVILMFILFINIISLRAFHLSAESVVLMDMDSNVVLYEQNSHNRMKTASIAKIMTAILAIENGFLDEYVVVSKDSVYQIGSKIYIQENDSLMLIDLIYGLMLRSGNDAAYLIAEHVFGVDQFVIQMNELAKKIGMTNTTFENPSGLDEDSVNLSTAHDMALLMSYAMKNDVFKEITGSTYHKCQSSNGVQYVWRNKHRLVQRGGQFTGGKTGYTKSAGRTLVSTASKDDLNLVVVTFRSSSDWNDHQLLFSYGFENYKKYLVMESQTVKSKNVLYDYIPFINQDITVPIRKDNNQNISVRIFLKKSSKDNIAGKVIVYLDGEEIFTRNVYKMSVEEDKRTFLEIFKNTSV
ncbi:D-alanyl-D-alanine carboxypeptidase family protein [Mycoplasmatota bacterium WC44]